MTRAFRLRHYGHVSDAEWNDWQWQFQHRLSCGRDLARILSLSPSESLALASHTHHLPVSITPYYASLLDPLDPNHPLRRSVVPTVDETVRAVEEEDDPLNEEGQSPVPGLVHRYPDRVLFLATGTCSTYCRYCTRSRTVGRHADCTAPAPSRWNRCLDYIAAHPEIRDVLISGGDPLTLPDASLACLLAGVRAIPHVEIIRIGTKVPMVLPQRVTRDLARLLARFHPLWLSLHVTHPQELTREAVRACSMLANAGIPLGSQTVLLRGINDDADTMRALCTGLLKTRVRPYYLYQCDAIPGSAHFRTPVQTGIDIIDSLRGHTTGYAVPTFVIDAPGGGGKVPVAPNYVVEHSPETTVLRNYEGRLYRYTGPCTDIRTHAGGDSLCISD